MMFTHALWHGDTMIDTKEMPIHYHLAKANTTARAECLC